MADNLERLILVGRHSGDVDALIEGIEIIRDQLFVVLDKHGLRELSGACNPFDPNKHETVGDREDRNHPDGSVIEVVRSGYRLHDKLVRSSQVIVSQRKNN
jgi:molecular chaperone GrpE